MVLHVVALLAKEDTLDKLIEMLVVVAYQSLDLTGLCMGNDFVFNLFAISYIREHQWQDCQGKYPRLFNE